MSPKIDKDEIFIMTGEDNDYVLRLKNDRPNGGGFWRVEDHMKAEHVINSVRNKEAEMININKENMTFEKQLNHFANKKPKDLNECIQYIMTIGKAVYRLQPKKELETKIEYNDKKTEKIKKELKAFSQYYNKAKLWLKQNKNEKFKKLFPNESEKQ